MKAGPCILYAEDDENDVTLMQVAFQQASAEALLHIVRDGEEAIDYLAGNGAFVDREKYPLPQLLLLDLKMPRKTGLEVLEWLEQRREFCCIPIVVLSASPQNLDVIQARTLGANSYIVKPIGLSERTDLVRALAHYWLHLDQQCRLGSLDSCNLKS